MSKEYSEDELVEKEAVKFLTENYKYEHLNCYGEFESGKSILGRETKSEVVLISKLKQALTTLNEDLPSDAIDSAIIELTKDRSRMSLIKANKEVHQLIKEGIKVKTRINNKVEIKTVKVIDFEHPERNDFFMTTQFWVDGEVYQRRPDLILFVNGLPLILMEFKKTSVNLEKAYSDNITDYKETIPQLFWYNSFIVISNGLEAKMGSITSGYEHFSDWKKNSEDDKKPSVFLDKFLSCVCSKETLLDLFENFTLFTVTENNKEIKVVAKNHQYLGVNNSIKSFEERKKNKGRLGVFWHTQGSGKSFSMIFFAQKILRKYEGNYTFLVVTDRDELDDQIYRNFQQSGVVTEENVQARNGSHLKQLLGENHRMIFTLIHKFHTEKGKKYEKISDRDDIIIMTDEAHRTQYDTLALNMRNALPNACFIGFTGTPLMKKGEEKTKEVFGDYVSEYNFRDSIEEGSTVPLYYENRVPELQLVNPSLTDEIYEVIDNADLTEQETIKIEQRLGSNYDIITREERLNTIAEDIVNHFLARGYQGKAMVMSIDKFTTVRMYDKVKYHLTKKIEELTASYRNATPEEKEAIKTKLDYIKRLDMAVIVSSEQNEVAKFKEKGLDIRSHRDRMNKEDLASNFKDSSNPLKIAFVCNMWITGFDVPSISTIYLDKPMKDHSLMQAIARANRVCGEKKAGFIVDYINVFKNLKKALAIYASSRNGSTEMPIEAKEELVKALEKYIGELEKLLSSWKVNLNTIIQTTGKEKYPAIAEARSKLVINDNVKKEFLTKAGNIIKIYRAILPHKKASDFSPLVEVLKELVQGIYSLDPEINIKEVVKDIQEVLDLSIASKGYIIREEDRKPVDIGNINFEKLDKQIKKNQNYSELEKLKNILSFKIREMIKINHSRQDFQERFEELIKDYNSGATNTDKYFEALKKLSGKLDEEQKRHVKEGLTEEELALFDKLKKPNLSEAEVKQIKKVAKDLLKKIYEKVVSIVDWRKKRQAVASAHIIIQEELDKNLPQSYTPKEYEEKCSVVFQHVYDKYGAR